MKFLFSLLIVLMLFNCISEEIMYWQVNDTATVDNENILTFIIPYEEDDNHWVACRVKVIIDNQVFYLDNLQYYDGAWNIIPGIDGVYFGESGDGYGPSTGNWATQSPLDGLSREIWESAMFLVEIGYITYDDVLDSIDWITLAETDPVAKSLLQQHLYERGSITPPGYTQWIPVDFYTGVPEPRKGLLILIGTGVLLLIRPKLRRR